MRKKSTAQQLKKTLNNLFFRFKNYTQNQKLLTLFLLVFAFFLFLFPIVKYTPLTEISAGKSIRLLSKTYFKSFLLIGLSMLFLLGWNMNIRFKQRVISFSWFRDSEPLVNFAFLWLIASVLVGISDALGMISQWTSTVSFTFRGKLDFVLLLIGVIISFIDLWKSAQNNSQRTKILNIVDDEVEKKKQERREIKHLFDDEDLED